MAQKFNLILLTFSFVLMVSCKKSNDEGTIKDVTIKDLDGWVYTSVTIGTQEWMVENLKVTQYNDGIELSTDPAAWSSNSSPGAYIWYDENPQANRKIYGALYNLNAVRSGKLCPAGWHVPSIEEWKDLLSYVGDDGNKLKEAGLSHWLEPNDGATNEGGFTALPGGYIYDGSFRSKGGGGYWWSSTETDDMANAFCYLINSVKTLYIFNTPTHVQGLSVRCLKD